MTRKGRIYTDFFCVICGLCAICVPVFVFIGVNRSCGLTQKNTRPLEGRPGVCEEEPRSQQESIGGYCASFTSHTSRGEESPVGRSR